MFKKLDLQWWKCLDASSIIKASCGESENVPRPSQWRASKYATESCALLRWDCDCTCSMVQSVVPFLQVGQVTSSHASFKNNHNDTSISDAFLAPQFPKRVLYSSMFSPPTSLKMWDKYRTSFLVQRHHSADLHPSVRSTYSR